MPNPRIKELRESSTRTFEQARDAHNALTPETAPEERQRVESEFDKAMEDYDRDDAEIRRLEKVEEIEAEQRERADREQRESEEDERRGRETRRPLSDGRHDPDGEVDIRAAFKDVLAFGLPNVSQEQRAALEERGIIAGLSEDRELRALGTATGATGGYTVPTELIPEIEKTMALWGPMLDPDVVHVMNTESGAEITWPTVDDTASRGEDVAENAEVTDDGGNDIVFGQASLSSYTLASEIMRVHINLLADSALPLQDSVFPDLFGERMARTANDRLSVGTGNTMPQGIAVGAGAGVTATSATAIAADELIDLQHEIDPAYRRAPGCGWMFNDNFLKICRKLKDNEGRYILQRADISQGTPATLLDKPYHINQGLDGVAAGKVPCVFGDLKKYKTRRVGNWTLLTLRERYAEFLQVGLMAHGRIDGVVANNKAIKKLKMAA